MKNIITIILAFGFVACGQTNPTASSTTENKIPYPYKADWDQLRFEAAINKMAAPCKEQGQPTAYCMKLSTCMFDYIARKYTYTYFEVNMKIIFQKMLDNGKIDACLVEAKIVDTEESL